MENKTANKKGGLYARVNMSVKSANIMVGVLVAALIIVSVFIVKHNGFTVKFDTDGGSYVAPVKAMYSETVSPADPVKEGIYRLVHRPRLHKRMARGGRNYRQYDAVCRLERKIIYMPPPKARGRLIKKGLSRVFKFDLLDFYLRLYYTEYII